MKVIHEGRKLIVVGVTDYARAIGVLQGAVQYANSNSTEKWHIETITVLGSTVTAILAPGDRENTDSN